jgi:hypothetical protein
MKSVMDKQKSEDEKRMRKRENSEVANDIKRAENFFSDEVSHEKRVRKNLMIDYTMYIT